MFFIVAKKLSGFEFAEFSAQSATDMFTVVLSNISIRGL
jgi:hypothetical protein